MPQTNFRITIIMFVKINLRLVISLQYLILHQSKNEYFFNGNIIKIDDIFFKKNNDKIRRYFLDVLFTILVFSINTIELLAVAFYIY